MLVVENMTIMRNNTWSRTTRGSSRNPTTCSSSSAAPSSDLSTVFVAKDTIMYFSQKFCCFVEVVILAPVTLAHFS